MTGAVIFNQSECCVRGRTRCLKKQWRPCRLSFFVPDLSPARSARRLVSRGFAARATSFSATSFITTKMRACSQATRTPVFTGGGVGVGVVRKYSNLRGSLKDASLTFEINYIFPEFPEWFIIIQLSKKLRAPFRGIAI